MEELKNSVNNESEETEIIEEKKSFGTVVGKGLKAVGNGFATVGRGIKEHWPLVITGVVAVGAGALYLLSRGSDNIIDTEGIEIDSEPTDLEEVEQIEEGKIVNF